jgi:TonB family protein
MHTGPDKPEASRRRSVARGAGEELGLLPVLSLVVWVVVAAVEVKGLVDPAWRLAVVGRERKVVAADIVAVPPPPPPVRELKFAPLAAVSPEAPLAQVSPALPAEVPAPPEMPAMPPVVDGPAAAPMAVPLAAPARRVAEGPPVHAAPARAAPPVAGGSMGVPGITDLTYGEGEADQPPPEYPREAQLGHQQGTVVIEFGVGADGAVTDAKVAGACRWPLLNRAALAAVRDTWKMRPGPVRRYRISIEFKLSGN